MRSQRSRWCCCQVGCDSCSTAARIAEPKTVEAKGAVDSQAAVQVEAKSKVMCGGFASVKTAIAESVYDCYCWRLVKEAEVLLRHMSCVRRVRLPSKLLLVLSLKLRLSSRLQPPSGVLLCLRLRRLRLQKKTKVRKGEAESDCVEVKGVGLKPAVRLE